MKNATASEFVDRIKQLVGTHNLSDEQEFLNGILIPKSKNIDSNRSGEFLTDLYSNYDLRGRIIGIEFLGRLNETSDFIFFASSDPFDIGIEKKTNKIIMYDYEFNQIHLKLANDINEFIKIILLIFEYGLDGWIYNKQYTKADRSRLLRKIKEIVDVEYLKYYEESYGN
ncbi:hypothetical protein [Polaribacter atrinae]|uniref:hypothetical protein n=1 Tax=Polaribacter atrinae TaxID=1333662 RepID=UPI0024915C3A|nr:hypothetical protein [Polaribacter atrinae]